MNVLKYQAHNIMGIKDIQFDLEGHHLFLIGGKNGNGKTSAITALLLALCGRSGMDKFPEIPLKTGEDEGWVKVDLSGDEDLHDMQGFTVELKLKRKRGGSVAEEFRILDSSGDEAPEPRTLLKKMFNLKGFDPLAFERMSAKDQRDLITKLLRVSNDDLKEDHKRLYDQRTQVGRDGQKAKSLMESLTFHEKAPSAYIDTSELTDELERAQEHNAEITRSKGVIDTVSKKITEANAEIGAVEDQIRKLEQKRISLNDETVNLNERLRVEMEVCATLVPVDEPEIREKIRNSATINRQVDENTRYKKAIDEVSILRKEYEDLSGKLEANTAEQSKRLQEIQWPVEGMSLDDQGVLLNDLPFAQASTAQRIKASLAIGMALNPKLRLLVCEDASALDVESLEAIDAELKANDFQLIAELVTRTKEDEELCQVIIQNGEAK